MKGLATKSTKDREGITRISFEIFKVKNRCIIAWDSVVAG
jgi:hypothetical protein